ncbi:MAG: GGDEF domain-containing protein [Gammaproteobacteria bacterium]|nr:MAG: GGDEF domain-containing protein [Gammaproteobacteria bacterium]
MRMFSRVEASQRLDALIRDSDAPVGALLLDLRRLARLNESYGYAAASQCLERITTHLVSVRENKGGVIYLGQGLWLCPVPRVTHPSLLELAGRRLMEALPSRIVIDDVTVLPRFFLASASTDADCNTGERLLLHAEHALRLAKSQHRPYMDYRDVPAPLRLEHWRIEAELYEAFKANALQVWFQPQVSLSDGRLTGLEALLRWESETRGPVSPELFIPVLEHSGFVFELTQWIFNSSLRQISPWLRKHPSLRLAINLSGNFVHHEELCTLVTNSTGIWDTSPHQVTLEVTESSLMWDWQTAISNLEKLRVDGFGVALDDFGTGYSSLLYFKDLPATEMKIDKAFVQAWRHDNHAEALVETLVQLAHRFGMTVVAEGVEDRDTAQRLRGVRADIAQGWHIAPAMTADRFEAWAGAWQPGPEFTGSSS